jgi:protein-tyrosine phosphatase
MDYFSAKGIAPVSFMGRHMLSAGPRPSKKLLVEMRASGITDLVTLLSKTEGAEQIGRRAIAEHVSWHWLPLDGADPLQIDSYNFKSKLIGLTETFSTGEGPRRIHVHCSAGIHRTGMVIYGLLRLTGLGPDETRAALKQIRAVAADGVREDRLLFIERILK